MNSLRAAAIIVLSLSAGAVAQTPTVPTPAWSRIAAVPQHSGTPVERGAAVFNNWCAACHSRDLRNAPGTRSLNFKYQGEFPGALEDRRDLTGTAITFFVRQGVATMPFYRKTEISDPDLQALIAYLTRPR